MSRTILFTRQSLDILRGTYWEDTSTDSINETTVRASESTESNYITERHFKRLCDHFTTDSIDLINVVVHIFLSTPRNAIMCLLP